MLTKTDEDTGLILRGERLAIGLIDSLGSQPSQQCPTIAMAGLAIAEKVLAELVDSCGSELQRGDVQSLVDAVNDLIEVAAPIIERFER